MRTANSTKPKTDFGIEVSLFCAQTGMSKKQLAQATSEYIGDPEAVKYTTLVETTTGRSAGHQLKPIVRAFMRNYMDSRAGA